MVYEEKSGDHSYVQTVIELSADVKGNHFVHVLEFLYTGESSLSSSSCCTSSLLLLHICSNAYFCPSFQV